MNDFTFVESIFKKIRERKESLAQVLVEGSVPDYAGFEKIRARLNELAMLEQDLKDLLKRKIDDQSSGT